MAPNRKARPATSASVVYGRVLIEFIKRVDEMVGDFAHGAGGFAALSLGIGHGLVEARFGAAPGGVAGIGHEARNLLAEPAQILPQRVQVGFEVGCGLEACARVFGRLVCVALGRRRFVHGEISVAEKNR